MKASDTSKLNLSPATKSGSSASKSRSSGSRSASRAKSKSRRRGDGPDEGKQLTDEFGLPPGPVSTERVPNPVELPAPINAESGLRQSVEAHRNLFCAHYDGCLDNAVKSGWNSFSCTRCAFYETTEEEKDGLERLATQRRGQ